MKKLMAGLRRASSASSRGAAREVSKGLGSLFWVLLIVSCALYVLGRAIVLIAIAAVVILGLWFGWRISRFLFDLTQYKGDGYDRLNRSGAARRDIMADDDER